MRRFVNIFVKDEDIRFLQNLETPLKDKRRSLDRAGDRGRLSVRFSDEEIRRYARQIVLPEVGGARAGEAARGDGRRRASEVEALYLAAAGVGRIVVPSEEIAAAARALNPLVRVEVGNRRGDARRRRSSQAALFAWRAIKEALAL